MINFKTIFALLFLLSLASADFIAVNGSDGTGGFETNLNNWTSYARALSGAPFTMARQDIISGTAYQGTKSYQETVALKGQLANSYVYESGRAFGPFYMPMNETFSWNFTGAVMFNKSIEPAIPSKNYNQVAMCINFNVTNNSREFVSVCGTNECGPVIFHYCKYINVSAGSRLANTSTDLFYEFDKLNATPLTWFNINRTNLTADFNSYLGAKWNVSNITATQIVNATGIRATDNRTFVNLFDAINISGFPLNQQLTVQAVGPAQAYNNETILFNFTITSQYNFSLSSALIIIYCSPMWSLTNQTPLSYWPMINTISWNADCDTSGFYLWTTEVWDIYGGYGSVSTVIEILENHPPLVNLTLFGGNATERTIVFNYSTIEIDGQPFAIATLYIWNYSTNFSNFTDPPSFTVPNATAVLSGPATNNISTVLSEGKYAYNIRVCDSFGYCAFNESSAKLNVSPPIDNPPSVNLNAPVNETIYFFITTNSTFNITFNFTPFDDHNFTNASIWIMNGSECVVILNTSELSNGTASTVLHALANGTYKWAAFVCDAAVAPQCAFNGTNFTFKILLQPPLGGDDDEAFMVLFFIMIAGACSIFFASGRRKRELTGGSANISPI